MADYYVIYRKIQGQDRAFEKIEPPPPVSELPLEQIIPGQAGSSPIHLRLYHQQFGQNTLHLLTYTHNKLIDLQVRAILLKAAQFAWGESEEQ